MKVKFTDDTNVVVWWRIAQTFGCKPGKGKFIPKLGLGCLEYFLSYNIVLGKEKTFYSEPNDRMIPPIQLKSTFFHYTIQTKLFTSL